MKQAIQILKLFSIRKPSGQTIIHFIASQRRFVNEAIQKVAEQSKSKILIHDGNETAIGSGQAVWEKACQGVISMKVFPGSFTNTDISSGKYVEQDAIAVVSAKTMGFWTHNAAVVSEVIEREDEKTREVGFAYITLPGHVMWGKEWFVAKQDIETEEVTFHLSSFSKPNHILLFLVWPIMRIFQLRFQRLAHATLKEYVLGGDQK